MLVILDNGHGAQTRGKRSPDGTLLEWKWCRQMSRRIESRLNGLGIRTEILVPEDRDIPLSVRCRRANLTSAANPGAILLSIHNNAAGDGTRWLDASGWCAFVSHNASQASRALASILTQEAHKAGLRGNRVTPPCGYWSANLAICRDTVCPAVLTENLFQDCRADAALLLSEEGQQIIADVHVNAVLKYFKSLQ